MVKNTNAIVQHWIKLSSEEISAFCQKWGIVSMAIFGSVLRADYNKDSDIDLLIAFLPEARQGLLTLAKIRHELEALLHKPVDVVVKESIEES